MTSEGETTMARDSIPPPLVLLFSGLFVVFTGMIPQPPPSNEPPAPWMMYMFAVMGLSGGYLGLSMLTRLVEWMFPNVIPGFAVRIFSPGWRFLAWINSILSTVCLLGLSLLPLASLLLLIPVITPDESVISNSIRPQRSGLAKFASRIFGLISGLVMLIAILAFSCEFVNALNLTNPYFGTLARKILTTNLVNILPPVLVNQWPYVILCVYACDLIVLFAIGKVPVRYNLRNVVVRWRISLLTGAAFTLVVGLLTVMLAFLNGLNELTANSGIPGNVFVLSDGATDELFSNFTRGDISRAELEEAVFDRNEQPLRTPVRIKTMPKPGTDLTPKLCSKETYFVINQPVQAEMSAIPQNILPVDWLGVFGGGGVLLASMFVPITRRLYFRFVGDLGMLFLSTIAIAGIAVSIYQVKTALSERGWMPMDDVELIGGEWFRASAKDAIPAVLSFEAANRFGPGNNRNTLKVGDVFLVRGQKYVVSGLMQTRDEAIRRSFVQMWTEQNRYSVERPRRRFVSLRGIDDPFVAEHVHEVDFIEGKWFSDAGVVDLPDGRRGVPAIIGEGAAGTFGADVGKDRLGVGDEFKLGDLNMVVVGVMKSEGTTFNSEVWTKNDLVAKEFGKSSFTTLIMRVEGDSAENAAIMAFHFANRYKSPRVKAVPEPVYYSDMGKANNQLFGVVSIVAAIMAIGGIFGVMNTMFAAIAQRTRDIGVLRILGFKRWQVLVSFMLESLFIAMLGGLMGCILGSLADGYTAQSILSSGPGGGKAVVLKITVDTNVLICGMLFTLVMGRLGGLLPALSGMRLGILESLR